MKNVKKSIKQATWQVELQNAITKPSELLQILELDAALLAPAEKAAKQFMLRVPRQFVNRMEKGNPNDPLLRQVLPLQAENFSTPGYLTDPLGEKSANRLPGLLHKYHGRVLLTVTGSCAIQCRYCFRRTFSYGDNNPGQAGFDKIVDYLQKHKDITEIILSGGDPLVATDKLLARLSEKLKAIPQLKTLRIHTRLPVVIPSRITPDFIHWLADFPYRKVLVFHCNHPHELSLSLKSKLNALQKANVTLFNQSVLLRGVNDTPETLIALSETLFDYGILPYYLHLLDKVTGVAHFDVPEAEAIELIRQMQAKLPGYLVPRLAREVQNMASKQLISVN